MPKQSLRFLFIRIPTFCYKFGWIPADYLNPIGIGTLTDSIALNSDDYATDPSNKISKYRVKELETLYSDDSTDRRRRNVAYTLGPSAIETTGTDQFSSNWTIYSNPTPTGGVFLAKDPYTTPLDYAALYPTYAAIIAGYKGILTGTFDMSAQPVLAWESAADQISILRVVEGLQTFTGYSPILFHNGAYVSNPATQTDAVIFYLKSDTTPGVWNYNTLYDSINQRSDTRRASAIYFRVQRDNFLIEYKMCDLPFQVQYLDNVTFSGMVQNPQPGDTFKQQLSMTDGNCVRFTALSAQYFVPPPPSPAVPASADDAVAVTPSIFGILFELVVATSADDNMGTIAPSISGSNDEAIVPASADDAANITPEFSGANEETVVPDSADDAVEITPEFSGANDDTIVDGGTENDTIAVAPVFSGALDTP